MPQSRTTYLATIASSLFIVLCLALIMYLDNITAEKRLVVEDYNNQLITEEIIELNQPQASLQVDVPEEELTLSHLLQNYSSSNTELHEQIKEICQELANKNVLESQDEIMAAINANHLDEEELGYLFLPTFPAEDESMSNIAQINVPLYLQKDAAWRTDRYGSATTRQLGENGCAILSLAMVHAAYQGREVLPKEILDWSKETYWAGDEGTSWQIFHNFANQFGYQFHNFGNDFQSAMAAVNEGQIIIASVEPGYFTEVGHILVIRGYEDGQVFVNDPNDDPQKMFSLQGIDEQIFLQEGLNYWSFSL